MIKQESGYLISDNQLRKLNLACIRVSPFRTMSHPDYKSEQDRISCRILDAFKRKYPDKPLSEYARDALVVYLKACSESKKLKAIYKRLKNQEVIAFQNSWIDKGDK